MKTLVSVLLALATTAGARGQGLYDIDSYRTFRLTFHQSDWWSQLSRNFSRGTDIKADLAVDGRTYKDVGIRFRGSSSYYGTGRSQKKAFNISMDAFVSGQDLMGYDSLNLSNSYNDPTFTREVVSYEILRRYMPAPRANYIKLVINNESWGVYINVQQPDKSMIREWFKGNDGNRYRADPPQRSGQGRSALQWLGQDLNQYRAAYELKSPPGPTSYVDLRALCNVLNNSAASSLPRELPKALNVDRALWYLALNSCLVNLDCYIGRGNDYYLYRDEQHGTFEMMPWDMNESFGGFNAGMSVARLKTLDIYWQETNTSSRPLMARVLAHRPWRERYLAHYRTIVRDVFSWAWIGGRVARYQKMIEADVAADSKKLYATSMFKGNLTRDYRIGSFIFRTTVPGLRPFVEERRRYLLGRSDLQRAGPTLSTLARTPREPKDSEPVTITVRAAGAVTVTLRSRAVGPFSAAPMFDDGKHGDGAANDGVWGAMLAGRGAGTVVDYFVVAAAADGSQRLLPSKAAHAPERYRVAWPRKHSPIKLNELLARNKNGITDEKGQHEDWLELVNTSKAEVDLSGLFLTDDLTRPAKWQIPGGTKLGAGAALLVWADDDPGDGPLHAGFKLGAGGEEVALFDTDGRTLLDTIAFGPQQADISTGRLFDGKPGWVSFPEPSPRARNASAACGRRLYTALDPLAHPIRHDVAGTLKVGSTSTVQVRGAAANDVLVQFITASAGYVPLPALEITLLFGPPTVATLVTLADAQGAADLPLPVPDDTNLVGARLYFQAFGINANGIAASGAVEAAFCPK